MEAQNLGHGGEPLFLGLDIGSSSSKAVLMNTGKTVLAWAVVNIGAGTDGPQRAVELALQKADAQPERMKYCVVTGYGRMTYQNADKQITEISCHARGAAHLVPGARTIIDIGGQDAKAIRLDENGRVDNFVMNDKCAAGTGRFLEVMARILDCPIGELAALSEQARQEAPISSTCTVFAESEVISQLAHGARREDVASGAHRSVAKRVAGLAGRIGVRPQVVMTGGVALNASVARALSEEIKQTIIVAEHPQIVGAVGAALYAIDLSK